jgi:hypothetical protein
MECLRLSSAGCDIEVFLWAHVFWLLKIRPLSVG